MIMTMIMILMMMMIMMMMMMTLILLRLLLLPPPFIVQQPYAKFRMKPQMASVAVLVPVMFAIFGPTCHKTVEPIHIYIYVYIYVYIYIYILIWDPIYHFTSTERGQHSGGGKVCNHKFWCLEKLFEFICTICLRNNVLLCFYHRSSKSTTVPDM